MAYRSATLEDLRTASEQRGTNLILRLNLVIAVSVALFTIGVIYELRERTLFEFGQNFQAQALLLSKQAQSTLDVVSLAEEVIANRIEASGANTPQELRKLLDNRAAYDDFSGRLMTLPQLQVLNVHDANGDLVLSTRAWPTGKRNIADFDYFKTLKSSDSPETAIAEMRLSRFDSKPVLFFARKLVSANHEFLGTVGGALNLDFFQSLYARVNDLPGESISLFRDDFTLIVHEPPLPGTVGKKFPEALLVPNSPNSGVDHLLVQKAGVFAGEDRLIAARRLASYPFVIKVGGSLPQILAGWRRLSVYAIGALVVIETMLFSVTRQTWRQSVARVVLARAKSEQARAEQQRLAAAYDLESLIETMPGVVARLKIGPRFDLIPTFIAPNVQDLTGFTAEQISKPGWLRGHISRRDMLNIRAQVSAMVSGKSGHNDVEIDFRHRDGRALRLHGRMSAQSPVDGVPVVVMIWTDVTVERARAAHLAHTYKLAMLGELATGIAHELSQPLSTISLAAENAHRAARGIPEAAARVVPKLENIIGMVTRAASVLEHMRVFGRTGEMDSTILALIDVIEEALPLAQSKLANTVVGLDLDIPVDLPPLLAKPVPLEQVLLNLISNACDAYAEKPVKAPDPDRVIRISAHSDERSVHIIVADHAGGIPPHVLERIFEPFFTTKPVGKGTGLGLSISYGIVTDLGGSIVASNENGGAKFVITLPRADVLGGIVTA